MAHEYPFSPKDILRWIDGGASVKSIAIEWGCSEHTIYNRLRNAGHPRRKECRILRKGVVDRLLNSYNGMVSLADLADAEGVTVATIRNWMRPVIIARCRQFHCPVPNRVSLWKVVIAIKKDSSLRFKPVLLREMTGIRPMYILEYLGQWQRKKHVAS
jgi:transposase-like protein